ncbi:MAG: hypothetical protein ACI8UO_003299 [Verrucomicrobiales bacterium]|jgi:hypothetical protein
MSSTSTPELNPGNPETVAVKAIGVPIPKDVRERLNEYNDVMGVAVEKAIDENRHLGIGLESQPKDPAKVEADVPATPQK